MESPKTKICPYCGETILAVAKKCRYCGEWLNKDEKPSSTPETENPSVETNDANQQQESVTTTDGQTVEQNHSVEETTTSTVVSKPKVTAIPTPATKPTLNKAKLFIAVGIILVIAVIMLIFHATYEYTTYWQEESTCQAIIGGVGLLLLILYLAVFCRKDIENMLKSKRNPAPTRQSTTKSESKKSLKALKWIVPIVVVLGLGGGGYAYYQHQKTSKEATYLQHAQKVKSDASTIVATADLILDDYYRNWRGAIYNKRAYNNYMEKVYCDDFNQAVHWRVEYYSDELDAMFSLLQSIQDHLQHMIDVPEKYASVDNSLKEVYGKAKELVSLCQYPEGNLATFSVKTQDAVNAVKKSLSDSDILIDASGTSSDKNIDTSRIYDAVSKSNKLDE